MENNFVVSVLGRCEALSMVTVIKISTELNILFFYISISGPLHINFLEI